MERVEGLRPAPQVGAALDGPGDDVADLISGEDRVGPVESLARVEDSQGVLPFVDLLPALSPLEEVVVPPEEGREAGVHRNPGVLLVRRAPRLGDRREARNGPVDEGVEGGPFRVAALQVGRTVQREPGPFHPVRPERPDQVDGAGEEGGDRPRHERSLPEEAALRAPEQPGEQVARGERGGGGEEDPGVEVELE